MFRLIYAYSYRHRSFDFDLRWRATYQRDAFQNERKKKKKEKRIEKLLMFFKRTRRPGIAWSRFLTPRAFICIFNLPFRIKGNWLPLVCLHLHIKRVDR